MALARANLIAAPAASARAARRRYSIVGYTPVISMAVTSFVPLGDRIVQRWTRCRGGHGRDEGRGEKSDGAGPPLFETAETNLFHGETYDLGLALHKSHAAP